jgi:hypothetical protein
MHVPKGECKPKCTERVARCVVLRSESWSIHEQRKTSMSVKTYRISTQVSLMQRKMRDGLSNSESRTQNSRHLPAKQASSLVIGQRYRFVPRNSGACHFRHRARQSRNDHIAGAPRIATIRAPPPPPTPPPTSSSHCPPAIRNS